MKSEESRDIHVNGSLMNLISRMLRLPKYENGEREVTSISEGQPLTILESYAAHKPVIATDVGNCYGLIYGESDDFGAAGIVTHIMNIEEIAQAMLDMAAGEKKRLEMGETGYRRVMQKYRVEYMQKTYWEIYRDFAEQMGQKWQEEPVKLPEKQK